MHGILESCVGNTHVSVRNDFQTSTLTFASMAQDGQQPWLTTADNMMMNHSHQCAAVEADLCWLNQLLALQIILDEWFHEGDCDD